MEDDDMDRARKARKGSPFLTAKQAAHYLGLGTKTLAHLRCSGEGRTSGGMADGSIIISTISTHGRLSAPGPAHAAGGRSAMRKPLSKSRRYTAPRPAPLLEWQPPLGSRAVHDAVRS
jgi:hypothetical protein